MPKSPQVPTKLYRFALAAAASTALAGAAFAPSAFAQASDPAAVKIESFDAAVIKTLRAGKAAGAAGRAKVVGPAVEETFDLPYMTRVAVGQAWTMMSPDDQAALQKAYARYAVANWAKNFDNYSGQKLDLDGAVIDRGGDKLVKTKLTGPGSSPVSLAYLMRQDGGTWKVKDVYYNGGISQLATQRSDFASTLSSGGAKALVAKLDSLTDKLLKAG
jgi:phospholipid transport system substrate-binding protein